MNRFKHKVVLITGAARGIGKTMAARFAREGAGIFLVDREGAALRKISEFFEKQGRRVAVCQADVAKEKDVQSAVRKALDTFGTIDILINNAGIIGPTVPVTEFPQADWDRVFRINVKGCFLFIKEVLPVMIRKREGCVINIASTAGIRASRLSPAYSASKGAIVALTRTLALAYASKNIRINCICPGSIEGDMLRDYFRSIHDRDERQKIKRDFLERHPLGHFGRNQDVAHAAVYLASSESSFVTGIDLVVDGGLSL